MSMHLIKAIASLAAFVSVAAAITAQASFFSPNGAVGECGRAIQNSDFAVALSPTDYANGARCGEEIVVQFQGQTITVTVEDQCVFCAGDGIDLTSGAFEALAPLSDGIIEVTYTL
ncbi:RlpA-like double-psi beta-barrel-protein domain-containing protein-containing protein [Mycena epipterygia]|nr:RlpA-like double-psi beta-barrel-protein domain-containing protein-containing protein [Mycena epipterygia]